MQTTITTFDNTAEGWERALYALLAEKEQRSGSRRTVEGYSGMVQHCFPAFWIQYFGGIARVLGHLPREPDYNCPYRGPWFPFTTDNAAKDGLASVARELSR